MNAGWRTKRGSIIYAYSISSQRPTATYACRRRRHSVYFIAEGRRPWNNTPVFSNSSSFLLLLHTPPESCRSNIWYVVSSAFLCFLCLAIAFQICLFQRATMTADWLLTDYYICQCCWLFSDPSSLVCRISGSQRVSLLLWRAVILDVSRRHIAEVSYGNRELGVGVEEIT